MIPSGRQGRCPYCGAGLAIVHVHGHGQCAHCGTNVDPCCGGANAEAEADQPPPAGAGIDPQLFPRLFRQLGDETATVTQECAVHALARLLDAPLDEAGIVLAAGIELGHVVARGRTVRLAERTAMPPQDPATGGDGPPREVS